MENQWLNKGESGCLIGEGGMTLRTTTNNGVVVWVSALDYGVIDWMEGGETGGGF